MTKQTNQSYWPTVWKRFRKNRLALWSMRGFFVLIFLAIFADFVANDKPLYCKIDGQHYFPVLHQYGVDLGWTHWEAKFITKDWEEHNYESVWYPPIPYSNKMDRKNIAYVAPFAQQNISSNRYRHWLGTDELGRDILAGLIKGTRTAMLVGIISMLIAALIGIPLGAIAGYFGDSHFQISALRFGLNLIAFPLAIFYAFIARSYQLMEGNNQLLEFVISLLIFFVILLLINQLAKLLEKRKMFNKKITIPVDLLIMRLIETINAIPALLLIFAAVAIIQKPSIFYIMAIIGFIRWTSIARFIRGELLRVRQLEYIEAAKAMGFKESRIIWRHAIPNALTPVLITIAFGIASAILLEASLSFLGIGVSPEDVTWGSMLSKARINFSAWWLAVFPGLAIFFTVTIFNLIGEGLTDAMGKN
ncbi:MAG TPA: ABC transporter permease [Saprospiraceae bacterium]|nr:ABC transporter permease [Saprospiraceae bacterium]